MIAINESQIDMSKLELEDIIDINVLQNFLDNFAIGFNCAAVSVGRNGEEFTRPSYYRPFCANYIHTSHIGDQRCADCHKTFGEKAISQNRPYIGYCHAGLVDFAAPVIINGEHIGTVLGGQILNKKADEAQIREVANEIEVDADGLWAATQKIDIVPEKTIQAAAEVLYIVVNALAQSGYNRIETEYLSSNLAENFIQLSTTIEALAEGSQDITSHQSDLVSEIKEMQKHLKEITGVLKSITKIADQTRILGINASIEAAHIGAAGRAFAIVADEISNLSDTTKQTVGTVSSINESIEKSIGTTQKSADLTLETTSTLSASMEELSVTVQNSVTLAEKLREMFRDK
ncbi:MAG: PocR ligand-binding domain-containing protein [Intestinimonas sp.]|jgi:ligand-binding sensor protein|nr:PocR ligand-binding domain-containing protein [Intestinimonas sp.]